MDLKYFYLQLGVVTYAWNPTFLKVEIQRITFQGQLGEMFAISHLNQWKLDVVARTCRPIYSGNKQQDLSSEMRLYLKNKAKRAGGLPQVVEYFHNKCEILSSNPSSTKKKYYICNEHEPSLFFLVLIP
jgi:hypothetical protein